MKQLYTLGLLVLLPFLAQAQFKSTDDQGLTIIVQAGDGNLDSPLGPPSNMKYTDPIRPLGMDEAIQAGAFLRRPQYGRMGFLLVFCVGDTVGGQQGTLLVNGELEYGVYRLIRQKLSPDEEVPKGMTSYRLQGKVYFLGIS